MPALPHCKSKLIGEVTIGYTFNFRLLYKFQPVIRIFVGNTIIGTAAVNCFSSRIFILCK